MNAKTDHIARAEGRVAAHPIDRIFLDRWSPRAYDGSRIPVADLLTLFEAARWAPSAYNYQPWRFVFARNGDESWRPLWDALLPFNQVWTARASALIFVLSDTLVDKEGGDAAPSATHSFDVGAAWGFLALQALRLGYHTRGMAGFDQEKAREALKLPDRYRIEAAVAVGRLGAVDRLPPELRRQEAPTQRYPLRDLVFAGEFGRRIGHAD